MVAALPNTRPAPRPSRRDRARGPENAAEGPAGRRSRSARLVLLAALLVLFARPAASEIYQWIDGQGTVHFTDELSSIPPAARGSARVLQRQAPITVESPPAGAYVSPSAPGADSAPAVTAEPGDTDDPATQAELLRAKIAAKEELIGQVDRKRSLATNPLRNRFVSPTDLELYRKYQAELPGDLERLKELESRIDSLSR